MKKRKKILNLQFKTAKYFDSIWGSVDFEDMPEYLYEDEDIEDRLLEIYRIFYHEKRLKLSENFCLVLYNTIMTLEIQYIAEQITLDRFQILFMNKIVNLIEMYEDILCITRKVQKTWNDIETL